MTVMARPRVPHVAGIYRITNTNNGKFYIGSSIHVTKRWWEHKKWLRLGSHHNYHLQASWNKHGENAFVFAIEEKFPPNTPQTVLLGRERELIDKWFDAGSKCFNVSRTTDAPDSGTKKHPVYQLDKTSGDIIRRWDSSADVERELGILASNVRDVCKGRLITVGGFRWRYEDEGKAAMFAAKVGRHGGHNKRTVVCVSDNNRTFTSTTEAAAHYGVRYTEIIGVCAGRRKHIKGLMFQYVHNTQTTNRCQLSAPVVNDNKIRCLACKEEGAMTVSFSSTRALASHVQFFHKMKTEDYTVQYLCMGTRPSCPELGCRGLPRYTSFAFKKYCGSHSRVAESEGGRKGGSHSTKAPVGRIDGPAVTTPFDPVTYGNTTVLSVDSVKLTKGHIATLSPSDREKLVEPLFRWFREHRFPYELVPELSLARDWQLLRSRTVGGTFQQSGKGDYLLSNKDISGSDLWRRFQQPNIHSVRTSSKASMLEAFANDETLRAVIRNRLGITYDKETFNITGAMLRQGFRSSASCALVSVFNSLIAKHVWSQGVSTERKSSLPGATVYDFSMGFGQRMLGALATQDVGLYVSVDPWTEVVDGNQKLADHLGEGHRVQLHGGVGAEEFCPPSLHGKVDVAFSSPPYFTKELYGGKTEPSQAVALQDKDWFLGVWWPKVVENVERLLHRDHGVFVLNMSEDLMPAMSKTITDSGFSLFKREAIDLSRGHLAKKHGHSKQKLEPIWWFKRRH